MAEHLLEGRPVLGDAAQLVHDVVDVFCPISIGFRIGSFACSSSDGRVRPRTAPR